MLWLFVFGPMFKITAGVGVSLSRCGGSHDVAWGTQHIPWSPWRSNADSSRRVVF